MRLSPTFTDRLFKSCLICDDLKIMNYVLASLIHNLFKILHRLINLQCIVTFEGNIHLSSSE